MQLLDNAKIEKKRQQTFELYQGQFDRYISDSKKEVSTVKGYQGRELLELIQNAEDECEDRKGTLRISLKNNTLRIENSGNPFSYDGILSLMTANYSPKDSNNFIGNKGLGFRSVLSWSNSVSIFSRLLSVRFSRYDADKMQEELLNAIETERLEKYKFDQYRIPVFSAPNTDIEYINPSKDMDTLILLECKDDAISRIKEQLDLINGKELLFLKNLGQIIIEQEDGTRVFVIADEPFVETSKDNLFFKKCLIETHEKDKIYEYNVYQSIGNLPYIDEDNNEKVKKYILSLAIPIGDAPSDENLYSYFRTNIKSPFRFILNATFELDDNRKYIFDNNDFNKQIISFLPAFIIESIIHNYSDKKNVSYDLLKELLIEDLDFLSRHGYNFKDKYLKTLKNSKVFPTVNNEFIDYNAEPVLYELPFAKILKGDQFDDLLQYTQDERIISFYNTTLGDYHYSQETMSAKINNISKTLSVPQRAYLIRFFVDYYCKRNDKTNHFPNLLIDSKNAEIKTNEVKLFNQPKEEELDSIPQFVQLRFVNHSLFEKLEKLINFNTNHKIRETIDKYLKHFGVAEYSFSSLESIINSTADSELSYNQVLELMTWVYKIYKTQKSEDLSSINLKLKLPINKRDFAFANKLYFDDKYDNRFYASLLKKASKEVNFVAEKEKIGFENEKIEDLIAFFGWLGVAKRPRKIKYTLSGNLLYQFRQFLSLTSYTSGQVWVYEYFFEMLEKLSTTEILKWLLDEQSTSNSIISSKNELQGSYLHYYYYKDNYARYFKSFVRWQLGIKLWIDIKNNEMKQRNSLRDCLLDNSIDVAPFLFNPKILYSEIKKYNPEYTETKVNALLEELGATIKLADLSFDKFYDLLFQLKEIDKEMRITRRVYRILFEKVKGSSDEIDDIIENDSYGNFVENGYVLAQVGKDKEFALVSETFYSDKKDLCNGILKTMNILDMERRLGQDKISKVFGVKTLAQTKVDIQNSVPHLLNMQFQELLRHIKPFLIVYRQDKIKKNEFELIRNIDITLCSSVGITYTINEGAEKEYCLSRYESIFSRDSKKAYICISNNEDSLTELKNNYSFRESLAELLTVIIDVGEGKDTYENLIRDDLEISQRRIEDSFGNRGLTLLEQAKKDLGETQSNEDAFWSIIKKIFKKSVDKIKADFSVNLNYDKINAKENSIIIIELFKLLSISIQQFNANSDGRFVISLVSHWNEQFALLKNSLADKYQAYQFSLIEKSKSNNKYELFVNEVRRYNFKQIESDCNSINFSIGKEFENLYGVSVEMIKEINEINIKEIRAQNIENYKTEFAEKFETLLTIYGNEKMQEAALFNEFHNLTIEKPKLSQDSIPIIREDKTNIILKAVKNSSVSGKEVSIIPKEKQFKGGGNHGGHDSNGSIDWRDVNEKKEDIGLAAEQKVYDELCGVHKKENVSWVSTYAERAKEIPKGNGNDNLHYDIAYIENGVKRFVEVKGSSSLSDISIKMTKSEYDFGNSPENIDRYDIHYVIVNKDTFEIKDYFIVKEFFKPRKDGGKKYELIQDTFTLLAKIEKEID